MIYDRVTQDAARQIVEKYRISAVKNRNIYDKKRKINVYVEWRGDYLPAIQAWRVWFEIENTLKQISNEISNELQPAESSAKIQEYVSNEQQLTALMREKFPDFYEEGQKAKLSMPEIIIYVLGKVIESK